MAVCFVDSEDSLLGRLLIDRRVSSGGNSIRSFSGSDPGPEKKALTLVLLTYSC